MGAEFKAAELLITKRGNERSVPLVTLLNLGPIQVSDRTVMVAIVNMARESGALHGAPRVATRTCYIMIL